MNHKIINKTDIKDLQKEVIDSRGNLILKTMDFWYKIDRGKQEFFMHQHGIYVLPTLELIVWLRLKITGFAIEIGAGNGAIGRILKIPITDSKLQNKREVRIMYEMMGQPPIIYPSDLEELDALAAIEKYKPDTVIGAFITHKYVDEIIEGNFWGVEEEKILKAVKKYINIGNLITHAKKPILKFEHEEHFFPWLITRSVDQSKNRIFIWKNLK